MSTPSSGCRPSVRFSNSAKRLAMASKFLIVLFGLAMYYRLISMIKQTTEHLNSLLKYNHSCHWCCTEWIKIFRKILFPSKRVILFFLKVGVRIAQLVSGPPLLLGLNPGVGLTRVTSVHEWGVEITSCKHYIAPDSLTDWYIMIFFLILNIFYNIKICNNY